MKEIIMKRIIISLVATLLLVMPIAIGSVTRDTECLPLYPGSLKDPGVTILEVNEDYYIIEVDGVYYVLVREK